MRRIMHFAIMLLLVMALSGCTKTHEKLITADELCLKYQDQQDPNELRDKHDECLLFEGERLTDKPECKAECTVYCDERGMVYMDSWTNFDGCHCTCQGKIEVKTASS